MSDFPSLLPPNATRLDRALEVVMAERELGMEQVIATLWNPYTCPVHLLPWLAWSFSVDVWDASWPEQIKRDVIAASIEVHRRKGTVGAVRRALAALGYRMEIAEWFETGGAPHTFRIDVDVTGSAADGMQIGPDLIERIASVIDNVKPVRSHYDLRLSAGVDGPAYVGAAVQMRQAIIVPPYTPPVPVLESPAHAGAAVTFHHFVQTEVPQ